MPRTPDRTGLLVIGHGTRDDAGIDAFRDLTSQIEALWQHGPTEPCCLEFVEPTIAQAVLMILQWLTEKDVSGTTMTVKKPDGSTTAMTFTLNSETPTSITRAS